MKIPIFRLEFDKKFLNEFRKKSEEIFVSGRPIGENKYVEEFEQKFRKLVGAKYATAVTSGTAAIELALKAVDVKGKVVLMPSNTFFATTVAALNAGADVELVDAEEENFSIDPNDLIKKIEILKRQNKKIGALVIVHIGGIISKHIGKIKKICKDNNVYLIEDAAHAHASKLGKFSAGTIGEIGCFSFFPTKVMTTGEGGMITTNSKKYYELIKSLKNFGRDNNNIDICINPDGNNYKISELIGLLGSLECDRVMSRIKKRNEYTDIYVSKLKNSRFVPVLQEKGLSSQYKMILKTDIDREWLRKFMKERGIALTGEVYKIPVHKQPVYESKFKNVKLPVTDKISVNHICPPLYPELTRKEVEYICKTLLEAQKEYEK